MIAHKGEVEIAHNWYGEGIEIVEMPMNYP